MSKYYVVRKGYEPGIYSDWSVCSQQVVGFKGAEYKSFKRLTEAQEYYSGSSTLKQPKIDGIGAGTLVGFGTGGSDAPNRGDTPKIIKPRLGVRIIKRRSPSTDISTSTTKVINIGSTSTSVNITPTKTINIYTDGSANGVTAGYGVVIQSQMDQSILDTTSHSKTGSIVVESDYVGIYGKVDFTKWKLPSKDLYSDVGELFAILECLSFIRETNLDNICFYCDSSYVVNTFTTWIKKWRVNGWKKSTGKPIESLKLIQTIDNMLSGLTYKFVWVKAHAGNRLNEVADTLAKRGAGIIS